MIFGLPLRASGKGIGKIWKRECFDCKNPAKEDLKQNRSVKWTMCSKRMTENFRLDWRKRLTCDEAEQLLFLPPPVDHFIF